MSAADNLREFIAPILGTGWRLQFGRWTDGSKDDRYAVLRPVGGLPAGLLRRPQFTLMLIGALNEDLSIASDAADSVVQTARTATRDMRAGLIEIQAEEPVASFTSDGRPTFEIAISTITN